MEVWQLGHDANKTWTGLDMMALRQAVWMQQLWCWLGAGPDRKMMEKGGRKNQGGWGKKDSSKKQNKKPEGRETDALLVFWNYSSHIQAPQRLEKEKRGNNIHNYTETLDQSQMFNFNQKSAYNQTNLVLHPRAANNITVLAHSPISSMERRNKSPVTHTFVVSNSTRYILILNKTSVIQLQNHRNRYTSVVNWCSEWSKMVAVISKKYFVLLFEPVCNLKWSKSWHNYSASRADGWHMQFLCASNSTMAELADHVKKTDENQVKIPSI